MRRRAVSILLLMSLFLNIAHAAVISYADSCNHEKVCEYVMEVDNGSDCGDLCEIHHMFHLNAITIYSTPIISDHSCSVKIEYYREYYDSLSMYRSFRPPII